MLDSHLFVVFGATGDLMHRKILPALHDLYSQHPDLNFAVLGASRSALSDEAYREEARASLVEHGISPQEAESWCDCRLFFQTLGKQTLEDYQTLGKRIAQLEQEHDLTGNRIFYLALPPASFEPTITMLGEAKLAHNTGGWTRLVVEKPFGQDLASAKALNALVHRYFDEEQVYRIDHYLGKETVQNLMVFRLGNAIFESIWNRAHIERVDILVAESLGVEQRAGYYDKSGALKDMVQNHLTQLLTLVAMEPPATDDADAIRHEKIKVLQSIRSIEPGDAIFGQYTRGKLNGVAAAGYREEEGVAADSSTPTYVAIRLNIANWRWQGVPFVLQTGKRMPRALTRIAVTFRRPPVTLFGTHQECHLSSNVLHITLQPDEGFSLSFEVKRPGGGVEVKTQQLKFRYEEAFGKLPDAYRTLLEDIVRGDQTLFVHAQEVEAAWRLYAPLLEKAPPVHFYAAGTWAPPEAERLLPNGNIPVPLYA